MTGRTESVSELAQAIADAAVAMFAARASAVLLVEGGGRLELAAASPVGAEPATELGAYARLADWVVESGQPMAIDDGAALMLAPLVAAGEHLGLIAVADWSREARGDLGELDVLAVYAQQAAAALAIALGSDRLERRAARSDEEAVRALVGALLAGNGARRERGIELLELVERLLEAT